VQHDRRCDRSRDVFTSSADLYLDGIYRPLPVTFQRQACSIVILPVTVRLRRGKITIDSGYNSPVVLVVMCRHWYIGDATRHTLSCLGTLEGVLLVRLRDGGRSCLIGPSTGNGPGYAAVYE
jgi:hypothetical protein